MAAVWPLFGRCLATRFATVKRMSTNPTTADLATASCTPRLDLAAFAASASVRRIGPCPRDYQTFVPDANAGWSGDPEHASRDAVIALAASWTSRPLKARRDWRGWAAQISQLHECDPFEGWDLKTEKTAFVALAQMASKDERAFAAFTHKTKQLWLRVDRCLGSGTRSTISPGLLYEALQSTDWDELARSGRPFSRLATSAFDVGRVRRRREVPRSTAAFTHDPIDQLIALLDYEAECKAAGEKRWTEVTNYYVLRSPTNEPSEARKRRVRRQRVKLQKAIAAGREQSAA